MDNESIDTASIDTDTLVAIIAAGGVVMAALISGAIAFWVATRAANASIDAAKEGAQGQRDAAATTAEARDRERHSELEAKIAKFSGPLLHAAYDLQSRLWNIHA